MEKIFILGNESSKEWANSIGEIITVPSSMAVNDYAELHDFTCRLFQAKEKPTKIIVDLDAIKPEIGLYIALHMRLSPADIGEAALLPLLFVSDLQLQSYLSYGECSQLFLCPQGVAFCHPDDVEETIKVLYGLNCDDYQTSFLDYIHIHPDATIGHHSMANQWGADVLNRIISDDVFDIIDELVKEKKKLYYKYIYVKTNSIAEIINHSTHSVEKNRLRCISAENKNILLIDDEANKGWKSVMEKWLYGAKLDDVSTPLSSYEDIPKATRTKIEASEYDLYLLDLRLRGIEEDNIFNPDEFSGMNILKKIKELNPGNQVIMMTASNKAWNMKALIDAGADGYYIKESPEFQYPMAFSKANFISMWNAVEKAFKKTYMKEIFVSLNKIKISLPEDDFGESISTQLDIAFDLILRAEKPEQYAFAYVSLYQVIEIVTEHYVHQEEIILSGNNNSRLFRWKLNNGDYIKDYSWDSRTRTYTPQNEVQTVGERTVFPQWKKVAGVVFQEWNLQEHLLVQQLSYLIEKRNGFIHNDKSILDKKDRQGRYLNQDIYDKTGFQKLFNCIITICSHL